MSAGPAPESVRTVHRAPCHPDERVKPAHGEVLVALHLPKAGPFIDRDRPLIERSDGEGIALGAQRHGGETKAGTHKGLAQAQACQIGP